MSVVAPDDKTRILPTIPGYRLHSILGVGGFATVYLGTQLSLSRPVALKVMNPLFAVDEDLCERFVREGQDLAVVSEHVNIVTVYDVGSHENYYFIAMQYLPGPTLKQLIKSEEPYQHPLHIITRIAEALAYAHTKGYIHRDIKPANILFSEEGSAVLSDFGIAKTYSRDDQLTQMGQLIGTELYMSPEQASMSQHLDARSDIYSLGVVFYETLTRSPPYKSTNTSSVTAQHIHSPIPILPQSEQEFQPLIDKMMAKNPDERYASMMHLLDDIQKRFFERLPTSVPDNIEMPRRSMWQSASIIVLSLLILGVLTTLFLPEIGTLYEPHSISAEDQITVDESLELAELNELLGRYDSPPGSNAVELYELVLRIQPENAKAIEALRRLGHR